MNKKLTACCLLFAVLMFSTTAKGDTILTDPSGTSSWAIEHFSNVDTYWDETKIAQTFRLVDADSHFTSFSLDLDAAVDVWWRIYNLIPTTIQVPDDVYAGFAADLFVNGKNIAGLSYRTDGVTFDTSELVFTGKGDDGVRDVFGATNEDAFTRYIDVDLSGLPETNELTFTWKLGYTNFYDFFPLLEAQAGYTQWDYCAGWLWEVNGAFDIAYDSERNANAATPEPATMLIFGLGLTGLALRRRFAPKA